jgi:hypothetical protein
MWGVASSPDGAVTVEVAVGGGLRAVRLTRQALALGPDRLAHTVLTVAAKAAAQANQRADHEYRRTLGAQSRETLAALGIAYADQDHADDDFGDHGVLR